MCDVKKLAVLIAVAEGLLIVAIIFFAVAVGLATNFYTAFGNTVVMTLISILVGGALFSINGAVNEAGACVQTPCRQEAETLQSALIALAVALTVLLAAVIIGIFFASIPWVGIGVAIALGIMALAIVISLKLITDNLGRLNFCRGSIATTEVTIATTLGTVAIILLVIISGGTALLG